MISLVAAPCGSPVRHSEFPMASGEMSADHVEAGRFHRATEKLLRTRAREAKDPMDRVRFEAEAERYAGEAAEAEARARR